jgi:hypothetical protein
MENENLMPKEQKECCRISKVYKISFLFQKQYYKNVNAGKKLCMLWIDYQKSFDSVPHSWIIKSVEIIGINTKVISFTKKFMGY